MRSLEAEFHCSQCDKLLDCTATMDERSSVVMVKVEPCPHCINVAYRVCAYERELLQRIKTVADSLGDILWQEKSRQRSQKEVNLSPKQDGGWDPEAFKHEEKER